MHYHVSSASFHLHLPASIVRNTSVKATARVNASRRNHEKKLPRNLRYPRRSKLPPDFGVNLFLKKPKIDDKAGNPDEEVEDEARHEEPEPGNDSVVWDPDEIEAISSLFRNRIPQKPDKLNRDRPLPLTLPHKTRPLGLPTVKKNIKSVASSRASVSKRVHKDPSFLIRLAREIKRLPSDADVSVVLNKWVKFLRKGSLSLTIRELGHMGMPERALQTFCWAQNQSHLFPDDRTLASTVQVLARHHELKVPFEFNKFTTLASKNVIEAMVKGFIQGGWLNLARKLLFFSKVNKRMLDPSVYVKMILELAKNPDKYHLVTALLDELKEREDLSLSHQDCTSVMKISVKMGRFELVESLFNWFKQSGREPSVVMYTMIIHSRFSEKKYREALLVVWEMEESNCLLDLPAYRVVIKLFVAMNDVSRATRYYFRLKEASFSPTYDIYRDMICIYMASGRVAKCKEICREVEAAGLMLDKDTSTRLLQLIEQTRYFS
ncbi:PREDICTED: pentatricopeptide repeat-containing protein At2g01860 [Tarenaya hassleriana]|uniref:pentatricopeptide repeat-containing protein At2g01860 n=1 Tax=Tarenaya hassleriana TaxID=28532 RepID=UPI00053C4107|nr:PREDICTED: pentatricopeptide repeat-containing protein At2g01860 [Tarenaya hassleriana]XP_010539789.1 PREDICTED: pentatricopeptide repeat-containing protein At2g01860 [Tarenaya hassleriana]XP_019058101.1 PREDICTED: pentatricopeptide repeat-containing protein At2g01860 [Tarenaya hassleriana]